MLIRGERPELAPDDDGHVVSNSPALVEILDQRGQRLVELGAVVANQAEVIAVAVPAAVGQRDATDASFDQAAGDQQVIVHRRGAIVLEVERLAVAVARDNPRVFLAQIEGVGQLASR